MAVLTLPGFGRWPRRLWQEHEEGVLYALAVALYIPAGYFLGELVLNWIVGITFPLVVVHLVPTGVRRAFGKRPR